MGVYHQMTPQALHEGRGFLIAQRPEARHYRSSAGLEEAPSEAEDPFAPEKRTGGAATSGQHDETALEIQVGHLAELQQTVLIRPTGCEQDRRALRIRLVDDRMGREVEDTEAGEVSFLDEALARLFSRQ